MQWFRWYRGACEDGKFRMVARNGGVTVATVIGLWAALLEDAADPEHRGIATRGEDFYAAILDLGGEQVQRILEAMSDAGLVKIDAFNITITNWNERQFETDTKDPTNAERQRRHRQKRKADAETRESNGSVTAETRPDTDTDTDITPLSPSGTPPPCEPEVVSGPRPERCPAIEPKPPPKATRLPSDWSLPSPWRCWGIEAGFPAARIDVEGEKFRDYWRAKAGKDATKRDWQATWRNWIRRGLDDIAKSNNGRGPPRTKTGFSPTLEREMKAHYELERQLSETPGDDEGHRRAGGDGLLPAPAANGG